MRRDRYGVKQRDTGLRPLPRARATRRDGDRLLLDLTNGLEVPVSRSYVASVRRAGCE